MNTIRTFSEFINEKNYNVADLIKLIGRVGLDDVLYGDEKEIKSLCKDYDKHGYGDYDEDEGQAMKSLVNYIKVYAKEIANKDENKKIKDSDNWDYSNLDKIFGTL